MHIASTNELCLIDSDLLFVCAWLLLVIAKYFVGRFIKNGSANEIDG